MLLVSKSGSSARARGRRRVDGSPWRRQTRRFKLSQKQRLSQQALDTHPHRLVGLEDLPGIRERGKRTHGQRESLNQRSANRHASTGACAELRGLFASTAALAGNGCIRVDADYTSQRCPRCGSTSRANRPQHGVLFVRQPCHFTLQADLVGASTRCLRTLLLRQDWTSTGQLSRAPAVRTDEAKAVRLWQVCPSALEFGHKPLGVSLRCLTA
jgi:putative transposase